MTLSKSSVSFLHLDAAVGISVFGSNFCLGVDMTFAFLRRTGNSDCRTRSRGLGDKTGLARLKIRTIKPGGNTDGGDILQTGGDVSKSSTTSRVGGSQS